MSGSQHRQMYARMCTRPRIDSAVFVKVARDAKFQLFAVGRESGGHLSREASQLQQVHRERVGREKIERVSECV